MHRRSAKRRTNVKISPVMIAFIVAVLGQAVVLFGDFGPNNRPHGNGMITAAAVMKAGAIEVPAGP
jgi:hypothetical protein